MKFKVVMAALLVVGFGFSASAELTRVERDIIDQLTDDCAGNGSGSYHEEYDQEKFDAKKIARSMVRKGCADSRYSKSNWSGVRLALKLFKRRSIAAGSECVKDSFSKKQLKALKKLIRGPQNRAVITALYGDEENPEACSITEINIYRKDGIKISIEFDETD